MSQPTPIPCPTCRYDLRGLVSRRGTTCPECGTTCSYRTLTEIDPFLPPVHLLRYLALSPAITILVLIMGPVIINAGIVVTSIPISRYALVAGYIAAFVVFLRILFQALGRHGRGFAMLLAPVLSAILALFILAPMVLVSLAMSGP